MATDWREYRRGHFDRTAAPRGAARRAAERAPDAGLFPLAEVEERAPRTRGAQLAAELPGQVDIYAAISDEDQDQEATSDE